MLGDVLEALGLIALAAAAYVWGGLCPALLAAAAGLIYLGNCHAGRGLKFWRRPDSDKQ